MTVKAVKSVLLLTMLLCSVGCQPSGSSSSPENHSSPISEAPPWVNRIWVNNKEDGMPGKLRIFMGNGILVMDSCWETYRLANWEARSDSVVVWREDTAEIEAHLTMVGPDELEIQLMLVSETKTERYREADVPFVCPDMQR